jgi:hypothetical protein
MMRGFVKVTAFWFAWLTLLLGCFAYANHNNGSGGIKHVPTAPVSYPCEEDEDCWDCHTMGNKICGVKR